MRLNVKKDMKKIYEKYNLLFDGKMYGDGSLTYNYDENGEFRNISADLQLYAVITELSDIRLEPHSVWKDKTIWPNLNTPALDILTSLLDTMVVKNTTKGYKKEFTNRRAAYTFSFEKGGKVKNFRLIQENAPYLQSSLVTVAKRVEEIATGRWFTYSIDESDEAIINNMRLQAS